MTQRKGSYRPQRFIAVLFSCKEERMKETEKQIPSFKKKLGNTTYTVKVHFEENSTETLVDKVKRLIVNDCMENQRKG